MSSKPEGDVITMTPTEAERILEDQKKHGIKNRPVSQDRVEHYKKQMLAGEWLLNGEPIILDEEGQILDGQHRLWACFEGQVSFKTFISRGVKRETFHTIDTGKARTAADVVSIEGYKNGNVVAAVLVWIHRYEKRKFLSSNQELGMTNAMHLEILERHPDIMQSLNWVNKARTNPVLRAVPVSPLCFLHYAFSRHNGTACEDFFNKVGDITPDTVDSPTRTLRRLLNGYKKNEKPRAVEIMAMVVKAWAAHLSGRSLKSISWRRKGNYIEDFPIFPGDKDSRGISKRSVTNLTVEDAAKFLKITLADGPKEYKQVVKEAKRGGYPVMEILHSAQRKKEFGVVSKREGNRHLLALVG